MDVNDLSNANNPVIPLKVGTKVAIAGSFTIGSLIYYLPAFAYKNKSFYGIPPSDLQKLDNLVTKKSPYDRLLIAIGSTVGLFNRKKKK